MITLAIALYIATPYAIDGDTVYIKGEQVRLVQVDTPELGTCYARQAREYTQSFLNSEGAIKLVRDSNLDDKDIYGRSLRYLFKGERNLNLELVRNGYAKPLFFNKVKGVNMQNRQSNMQGTLRQIVLAYGNAIDRRESEIYTGNMWRSPSTNKRV